MSGYVLVLVFAPVMVFVFVLAFLFALRCACACVLVLFLSALRPTLDPDGGLSPSLPPLGLDGPNGEILKNDTVAIARTRRLNWV